MYESLESNLSYLDNLNNPQLEAVHTTDGPLLMLAGAGTGKTRVLTSRIAHILASRLAFPSQILAVTFTNKAAREMRSRVDNLTDNTADGIWLGTFHAISAKILRRNGEVLGLTRDFTIIDYDDQIRLAKQILADFNIDDKKNPPRALISMISRFKDKAWSVGKVPEDEIGFYALGKGSELYAAYQQRLKLLNAVDFGDLILLNIELFNNHPDVLLEYQNKFKYILVDEYQDTNIAQYLWLRILAQGTQNICCVGDDDQSIYGWRGAEVTNILRFDKDFKGAKIIRLEENYRSTNNILEAASALISNNQDRHGKKLWTGGDKGKKLKLNSFYDDKEEARYVAEEIESINYSKTHLFAETAILVRAGYQTRSFEESFNFLRIPYRILGGVKFYERVEIRDALAYIRVLVSPNDSLAFERIINTPRRGVGNGSIQKIMMLSKELGISYYEASKNLIEGGEIKGKTKDALLKMFEDFENANIKLTSQTHWQTVEELLGEVGYIQMWKSDTSEDSRERIDNIKELIRSLQDYADLREYLEHISLVTDTDSMQDGDKVNIMTMHSAKGLEFETVFLPGWEEGIFPSQKSLTENGKSALEEERRLAYVGMTRAKKNLYISYACNRRIYGSYQPSIPSRFIDELPSATYEIINNYSSYYNKSRVNPAYQISTNEAPLNESPLKKSQRVFNVKFGYGFVLNINGNVIEVAFDKAGIKSILAEYLSHATS